MKKTVLAALLALAAATAAQAQEAAEGRYIEVTGTAEVEIVPDKIHYLIEIREYYEEEFDGHSKPEDYRTKVPLERIESELRTALAACGVGEADIRMQEAGDHWRERGQELLVAKQLDLTLTDFGQIGEIVKRIDARGVRSMRIGELESRDMQAFRRQGKIEALKAARDKAAYLAEALGKKLGDVVRIVEPQEPAFGSLRAAQSNVAVAEAAGFDQFRTIRKTYSMLVRFEIADNP